MSARSDIPEHEVIGIVSCLPFKTFRKNAKLYVISFADLDHSNGIGRMEQKRRARR
jgi:hypothetical protein